MIANILQLALYVTQSWHCTLPKSQAAPQVKAQTMQSTIMVEQVDLLSKCASSEKHFKNQGSRSQLQGAAAAQRVALRR